MDKIKTISQITDSKLCDLLNKYFDVLIKFGLSVQNKNYHGKNIFELLTKTKSLFDNQKFDYTQIDHLLVTALCAMLDLESEFKEKAKLYALLFMEVIEKKLDFDKTSKSYSSDIIQDVIQSEYSILSSATNTRQSAEALVMTHIRQTEKIQYPLIKPLKQLSNHVEYDLESLFSINDKIRKGDKHVTESKAIRDAVSHSNYKINEKNSQVQLIFENKGHGYDFSQKYSLKEFYNLVQKYHNLHTLFCNISYIIYLRVLFLQYSKRNNSN